MSRDRVLTPAQFAMMEREAVLYATRASSEKRRKGREDAKAGRWNTLRSWLVARGLFIQRAAITILHHGWHVHEVDLPDGKRLHIRAVGAGFYLAVLGTGARGRLTPDEIRRVIDALAPAPSSQGKDADRADRADNTKNGG